jgi:hypothetical protein
MESTMNDRLTTAPALTLLLLGLAGCTDRLTTEAVLSPDSTAVSAVESVAGSGCTVLESQSWWSTTDAIPLGGDSEHAHVEVCFPYRQVIDGRYTFTIVSRLHNVSGWYLRNVRVQAASDQDGNRTLANVSRTDVRCQGRDCTFTTPVTVDLSTLPAGEWEFRFHTEIRPTPNDPLINRATTGWVACVRSCSGRTPQAVPSRQTEARGWYREANGAERGYVNARFVDPLPSAPVSGSWCPRVRTLRGVGDEPVTRTFISIDPAFHATPADPGMVLRNAAGSYDGRPCIDTTRLANGRHRLFIRADWEAGPLAGALVVPFEVSNP